MVYLYRSDIIDGADDAARTKTPLANFKAVFENIRFQMP